MVEARDIDYKLALPGGSDAEKREFLADVSSFANAGGGDIVFGVDESGGAPTAVPGLDADLDAAVLGLESSIRDGVAPRIQGFRSRPIRLENGKRALVLRVPRSFARPHVVVFKNWFRFFTRSSNGKHQMDIDEVRAAFLEDGRILDPSEQVNEKALYAIYGADDGGQQTLGLFDEGEEDQGENLVDLGEAVEMFRQMREEDPHEFYRIASLRDGIRAVRRNPACPEDGVRRGDGNGTYVFCRAGEHRCFYAVDGAGEAGEPSAREISTQAFLGALQCEPSEGSLPSLPAGHNAAVAAAKKRFNEHLQRVSAQKAGQAELPRGQRYALKELQKLYGQLGREERRETIERLEEVFRFETNMAARRELNSVHRSKLVGDELIRALEKIYAKYRLGESGSDSRERRRRAKDGLAPRVVVSEAHSG